MSAKKTTTTRKKTGSKKGPAKKSGAKKAGGPSRKSGADTGTVLYLIDGHAQIFRAYHAIRGLSSPVTNEPTNATFGFVGMLIKLFRDVNPDHVAMAIDVSGDRETFRTEIDPDYKANRDEMPDDLAPQVERILQICQLWGIPILGVEGYEADDVIATVCDWLADEDVTVKIVSRDKDLQQLLGPRVQMYDIHKDETITAEDLEEDQKIRPEQVRDMLALMGDKVDNIPGVPGVGPKTAAKLIAQHGSIENLLAETDQLSGKLKQNIEQYADQLKTNRELVRLRRDAPVDFELPRARIESTPKGQLEPVFKQLGFSRHLRDLDALPNVKGGGATGAARGASGDSADAIPDGLFGQDEAAETVPRYERADAANYEAITTAELLDDLIATLRDHAKAGGVLSFDTETDRIDPMRAKLVGIALSWEPGRGVYVPVRSSDPSTHLDEPTVLAKLGPLLEDPDVPKVGQNVKYDVVVLRRAGLDPRGVGEGGFDTMVASYLLDATRTSHKLDNLALAFLNHEMVPISKLIGSGKHQKSMIDLPAATVAPYAGEDADIALRLREQFQPELRRMGMGELFDELEMPLVDVLAELEFNGILADPDELDRQNSAMDARIHGLHDQILQEAGVHFNPDSPKQLADVLFNELGCEVVKRTKTGPSTDSEVLQRIADEQPPPGSVVAGLILEYRQLTKLRGTYLESLKQAIHPETGRIHASFNQTVTATGRLSSSDPNLQNIPVRTELGRQIRKAFIAPEGRLLLGADYSQIELRMLAHLSQDKGLMRAFEEEADIHRAVAAEVFGVEPDEVTKEQRSTAKMVNFGIVYGVTPYGLARRLPATAAGSSPEVARQIIDDYKRRYPRIEKFLDHCVRMAAERGYVETICHRRRPIRDIHSNNGNKVALAKRMAINTVVQGSAADLIKTAMVRLHRRIRDESRPLKMLLQIHDELIFEVPEDQADEQATFVVDEMKNAMDLSVPLRVDASSGRSWFEAK